jgi:hypothetical protein
MDAIDFSKTLKGLYSARRKVEEISADTGTFLAVEAQGRPGGEEFQRAVEALYGVAYTLKFACKAEGSLDFKVNKLECLYLSDPCKTAMDDWQWRLLVRIPDEVTAAQVAATKKALREKKGLDAAVVKRIRWKEGRSLQAMHVGPYDAVGETYKQLGRYAQEHGLEVHGPGHEIYISDPRRTAPEKLKTIVRLGVKKTSGKSCRCS